MKHYVRQNLSKSTYHGSLKRTQNLEKCALWADIRWLPSLLVENLSVPQPSSDPHYFTTTLLSLFFTTNTAIGVLLVNTPAA